MAGLVQILNHSLKRRFRERFGKENAIKIINCIRKYIIQGLQKSNIQNQLQQCLSQFLDPVEAQEIVIGLSGHITIG